MLTKPPFFPAARPINAAKRGYSTDSTTYGFNGVLTDGRAGVHRPIYPILSVLVGASWVVVAGVQIGCGLHSYEVFVENRVAFRSG